MQDKKSVEQLVLQKFISLLDEFPDGKITACESPDFLLRLNTRKAIGIELTELKGQDFRDPAHPLIDPYKLPNYVSNTIQGKEKKIYLYRRKKLFRLWLLIHVDSLGPVGRINTADKLGRLRICSDFDRIFLLELSTERLFKLKV
ncbi:MAG: hypothetical protein AB7D05_03345 [Mangrovibacterium sp.]